MKQYLLLTILVFALCSKTFGQSSVKLSSGQFGFAEGPVWDRNDKIYFSDIQNRKIFTYSISNNSFTTAFNVVSPARTNGLMFDSNLDLIVCEFRDGQISKRTTSGVKLETFASGIQNANDLCLDKKEGVYVSSPNSNKIYYIDSEAPRTLNILDETISSPNGIIISIDGKHLFVNDSDGYDIYKYDINQDTGLISNRVVFATLVDKDNTEAKSLADGMALDNQGNLYVTSKKSIQVFDVSGSLTKTFDFSENPTNCTFGGANLEILFVTTPNDFYKIDLVNIKGFQHPFDLPEVSLSIEKSLNSNIKLFPNPSYNNEIFITNLKTKIQDISLFSLDGKKIEHCHFQSNGNSVQINLRPELKSDVYVLAIADINGAINYKRVVLK